MKNPFQRLTAYLWPVLDFEQATPKPSFLFLFCFLSHLDSCCITHVCSNFRALSDGWIFWFYQITASWRGLQAAKQPHAWNYHHYCLTVGFFLFNEIFCQMQWHANKFSLLTAAPVSRVMYFWVASLRRIWLTTIRWHEAVGFHTLYL